MDEAGPSIDLGLQLGVVAVLVLAMTMIHSVGLIGISRFLKLRDDRLEERKFDASAVLLLGYFGLFLFALHFVEILIFAFVYLIVGAIGSFEESLYYSASAYATLGRTADYFPEDWRLVGAMEALVGFILIGWSTAFMVSTMRKITD